MAIRHSVTSFEDFDVLIKSLEVKSEPVFVLITGAKNDQGKSWCPDCVKAEPFIEDAVATCAPKNCQFVVVSLQREFWKDPKCVFRTDSRMRLTCIPSLMRWPNYSQKLQEEQCADPALLKMLFEDD